MSFFYEIPEMGRESLRDLKKGIDLYKYKAAEKRHKIYTKYTQLNSSVCQNL